MTINKVKILVPTMNEERNIGLLLSRIKTCNFIGETIIIDGNSTDDTLNIVKQHDVTLLMQKGKGKGNAIREALDYFKPEDPVIMMDGDMSYDPVDVSRFLPLMAHGVLINGSRFSGTITKGAMTKMNYIGNKMLNSVASILYHARISDLLSGMKGFFVSDIRSLNLESQSFEIETEIILKYLKHFRLREVPISYSPRAGSSKLEPLKDGMKIFSKIITYL
jgi:glycosyltransferase involved in cell wall biosynthesis